MGLKAFRYDAEGHDQAVELTSEQIHSIAHKQLLWIDVEQPAKADLKQLQTLLGLDDATLERLGRGCGTRVEKYDGYLQFAVVSPPSAELEDGHLAHRRNRRPEADDYVHFLISDHWIVTVHAGPIKAFEDFRAEDRAETVIGALTSYDFAASLLDLHLEGYFSEIARIEDIIDRLDEQALLNPSGSTLLSRMVALRRRVSRLRASLAAQRSVFYSLARPDLQVEGNDVATSHLKALIARFERAFDEAEHTRDMVVGSFELFATRTAQQTNELVKVLTYLTAVIGICAAVAGLFGMNFETRFFSSGDAGFYATIISLAALAGIATIVARWRGWI